MRNETKAVWNSIKTFQFLPIRFVLSSDIFQHDFVCRIGCFNWQPAFLNPFNSNLEETTVYQRGAALEHDHSTFHRSQSVPVTKHNECSLSWSCFECKSSTAVLVYALARKLVICVRFHITQNVASVTGYESFRWMLFCCFLTNIIVVTRLINFNFHDDSKHWTIKYFDRLNLMKFCKQITTKHNNKRALLEG